MGRLAGLAPRRILIYVGSGTSKQVNKIDAIESQTTLGYDIPKRINGRQAIVSSEAYYLRTVSKGGAFECSHR